MLKIFISCVVLVRGHRLIAAVDAEMETRDFANDEMLSTGETNMDDVSFTDDTMSVGHNGTMKQASQITWKKVAGCYDVLEGHPKVWGLKQVSVGWKASEVWGVTRNFRIYWRQGKSGTWQKVGGDLVHVSVNGKNGEHVWGVNFNNDIYYRAGLGGQWKHIAGKLTQISVGQGGHVWGVNRERGGTIYFRNGANGQWKGIGGKLVYVSVGGAKGEHVWGVNRNGDIYYRNGVGGQWVNIPGKLVQIEVSDAGEVYGVNSADTIYKRIGGVNGKWVQVPGELVHVDIGGSRKHTKYLWGANRARKIFYRKEQISDDGM